MLEQNGKMVTYGAMSKQPIQVLCIYGAFHLHLIAGARWPVYFLQCVNAWLLDVRVV
jgi:hypothetical protein